MANIYELLSDDLTQEFTWRLREIHQLRSAIGDVSDRDKESVTRASFVLLYAHWEGFVKRSTELFIKYLIKLDKTVEELHVGAKVICVRRELGQALTYKNGSNRQVTAILELMTSSNTKKLTRRHAKDMVQSANMDFDEFADVCVLSGLNPDEFREYRDLIDKILVNRRHQIAHGAYLRVKYEDLVSTSDDIIAVMRIFRNKMESSFMEIAGVL